MTWAFHTGRPAPVPFPMRQRRRRPSAPNDAAAAGISARPGDLGVWGARLRGGDGQDGGRAQAAHEEQQALVGPEERAARDRGHVAAGRRLAPLRRLGLQRRQRVHRNRPAARARPRRQDRGGAVRGNCPLSKGALPHELRAA